MKSYKWAYDDITDTLDVWPVDGPEPYACPQHGEHLTQEQYATFYQGRIVLDVVAERTVRVLSFTFYENRPYKGRTDDGAARARNAIDAWVECQ